MVVIGRQLKKRMIDNITKHQKTGDSSFAFSVLIPSWNNLGYLQNCIRSIRLNSSLPIQIIVVVNEGSDGTKDWLETQTDIDFVHSPANLGICYGLNCARSIIKSEYIVYVNDDMYLLPQWDTALRKEIEFINSKSFMLSCTMIEPTETGNACVVVSDYGRDLESFREEDLLKEYTNLYTNDWNGSTWPPNVVHIDVWDLVGGMSIEYSPGMYSDPDFSRKLYEAGIRTFKGLGNSLVYHFGSKSTKRIKRNKGKDTFLFKWGITSRTFSEKYLKSGTQYDGSIGNAELDAKSKLMNKLKKIVSAF